MPALAQPPALPALGLSVEHTATIGVSSGGYMAEQLAVAWPSRFEALGLVASGPWGCALGELGVALGQCMGQRHGTADLAAIDRRLQGYREQSRVGDADDLAELRVYLWHGDKDGTIDPAVGHAAVTQWQGWLADERQLQAVFHPDAGHGWPTTVESDIPLADCSEGGPPYLLDCHTDLAGDFLTWWLGALQPAEQPESAEPAEFASDARLIAFDQREFDAKGLADTGFLYLPEACEQQQNTCKLVVAFHGCEMAVDDTDDEAIQPPAFAKASGLNRYAERLGLVVLYPQAEASLANPKGCWDWWGFSESTWQQDPLHDSRDGRQVSALMSMIDRLQQRP
ncbi:alpha/beta hydrolase [Halomonas cupida]|uniref:alpha/beta hydrolase n=1 Tax=Halomonas TaxID=2745 RepID=UPI001F5CE655|nr:alpha/beta hydrolase [Halomonas litopenaei]